MCEKHYKRVWRYGLPEPRGIVPKVRASLLDRFMHYTLPMPAEIGCWLWTGAKTPLGYGNIRVSGKTRLAHHIAMHLFRDGTNGKCVLHRCDTPACVNPDHLFLGNQRDNVADMVAKGRQVSRCGEEAGRAKLTNDEVLAIRASTESQRKIASRYHVSPSLVCRIRRRDVWRHI